MELKRKVYDDLPQGSRQYIQAINRANHDGGLVPMDVFLVNMVEHGLLVARVADGKRGGHPDDFEVQRAPGFTDEEFKAGFDQLAPYMEDANS